MFFYFCFFFVSNSPCGVERVQHDLNLANNNFVSNSPCGVERVLWLLCPLSQVLFLIHRVELKDTFLHKYDNNSLSVSNSPCGVERSWVNQNLRNNIKVSNSPCGVERIIFPPNRFPSFTFLIHRVELKGGLGKILRGELRSF